MKHFMRKTIMINKHNAPIVVRGTRNGLIITKFHITIRAGGHEIMYHGHLNAEYNISQPSIEVFVQGNEDIAKVYVLTNEVLVNEAIEFGPDDEGNFTHKPIKGKFLSRFRISEWLVPSQVMREIMLMVHAKTLRIDSIKKLNYEKIVSVV